MLTLSFEDEDEVQPRPDPIHIVVIITQSIDVSRKGSELKVRSVLLQETILTISQPAHIALPMS